MVYSLPSVSHFWTSENRAMYAFFINFFDFNIMEKNESSGCKQGGCKAYPTMHLGRFIYATNARVRTISCRGEQSQNNRPKQINHIGERKINGNNRRSWVSKPSVQLFIFFEDKDKTSLLILFKEKSFKLLAKSLDRWWSFYAYGDFIPSLCITESYWDKAILQSIFSS